MLYCAPYAAMEVSEGHRKLLVEAELAIVTDSLSGMGLHSDDGRKKYRNNLERKRRNNLKASFKSLCVVIPDLENDERASKAIILQKTSDLVQHLCHLRDQQTSLLLQERNLNRELVKKLGKLNSELRN